MRTPVFWCARGVRERAICKPPRLRTVDSTASLRSVSRVLHNDAAESTLRWLSGLAIARSTQTP
eukprot:4342202-Lingulodinium_polyedra.AAC.1